MRVPDKKDKRLIPMRPPRAAAPGVGSSEAPRSAAVSRAVSWKSGCAIRMHARAAGSAFAPKAPGIMDPPARAKPDRIRMAGPSRLPGLSPNLPRRELLTKSNEVAGPIQRGRAAFLTPRASRLPPTHSIEWDPNTAFNTALREAPGKLGYGTPAARGHVRTWKGNLTLPEDKSWLLTPRAARNEGPAPDSATEPADRRPSNVLLHHLTLGEEHIIGLLRKLEWFRVLPERDLKTLYQRGRHRAFSRYSAITREGSSCDALHILLHGQLKFVSASKSTTIIKNAGAVYGESALVAHAQLMDASVYAETDCFVLQLSRSDIQGLGVDADVFDLRSRVALQLLVKTHFFKYLTKHQLDGVAQLMDIATLSSGEHLFHEGDPGTALYVLSQGRVEMYRRRTAAGEPLEYSSGSSPVAPLAVCTASSDNPWFGELALWKTRPRAASAVCTEPTRVLILRSADFSAFLDIVPTFAVACSESENTYWALEHAFAAYASDAVSEGGGLAGPLVVVGRWERLATALLEAQLPQEAGIEMPDSWLHDPYAGVGW